MMLKIGARIRRLRMEKDVRQSALAAFLGVEARDVEDWEQDVSYPPLWALPKLAAYFETTTDELLCMDSYSDDGYAREIISEYRRLIDDNHISQAADKMRAAAQQGFINATDLADYLVKKGLPFRSAYKISGQLVALCLETGQVLEELPLAEYRRFSPLFDEDLYAAIDLNNCMEKRSSEGGTSLASVEAQLAWIKEQCHDESIH